jgi:phenol hydroxylase P0 protein
MQIAAALASNLQSGAGYTRQAMSDTPNFNTNLKFVRIIETHTNGLVEFEFAVGEPELFVELLMAQTPFDEFCAMHGVMPTQGRLASTQSPEEQEWDWSLRAAREQSLRHDNKA